MENLNKAILIRNGNVIGTMGDKYFSTAPLGTVLSYAGQIAPYGYLLCDGANYLVKDYPDLYAVIGNTYGGDDVNFNVPDYRETVLVGVGENTTDTITEHDVYELGEFKDDQLQTHIHKVKWHATSNSGSTSWIGSGGGNYPEDSYEPTSPARIGTTTHGKQKGVTYIIKAKHTNEGTDTGVSDDVVEYVEGEIAEVENKIKGSVTHSFNTQDGKVKYLKLKLNANTISIVDIYGGKIEILGANNSNANPDYKTVKVVRLSYGDWSSYDAMQVPSVVSTKIGNLYYYPTDNYYYLQLNNYANFTVTGATTIPELVASLPVATSEMTLIPESAFASKSAFTTTNKRIQGATPFYEMYFAESRYKKLTVDLYYGREVTFSVNNLGYEGIISVYSSGDSASACTVKNIGVRGNPQGNISVKWGNFKSLGGSGHYQVDLFIFKVNANNTMIIRPRTQQVDGYSKIYTSADFVTSSQTEYEAAEYTAVNEYENINDSSTGNAYSTWSSSKIASELKTSSNKELTEITFTNSTNWSNSSGNLKTFYMVRNGWCFLHVVAHCNKVANDSNSVVYSGLPKPPFQVYGKFLGETLSVEPCELTITPDGKMLLRGGTVGKDYSFTYTYPVA